LEDFTKNFIERHHALFEKRAMDGRIRDLHGDLHTAHICFTNGVCVYDCIEFNDRFRYGDVASEVAFLAMDLDHYGRADLSRLFINSYIKESGDEELRELMPFYKSYRAYVRGKVACFKLDDPYVSDEEKRKTLTEAGGYFQLSESYVKQKPTLFITAGLVGCGKSSFSQALAARLGLVVISSDVTRKRLAGIPPTEHRYEDFDSGIYSPEFGLKTYAAMFKEAESILTEGYPVILDASFIKPDMRQEAVRLAKKTGADFLAIECSLAEEKVKERLQHRLKEASPSDGRWEIYPRQKKEFEPLLDIAPSNYAIIDTSEPVEANIEKVIDRVGQL
jgi:predicted kinase